MFESTCHFETLAISFTPHCLWLSEETLKAVGPFYLVCMTVEVKSPNTGVNMKPDVDSLMTHCRSVHDAAMSVLLITLQGNTVE